MKVGIHKDIYSEDNFFVRKYEEILKFNNIECVWMDINDSSFWNEIKTLDLFIYRWRHYDQDRNIARTILPIIEKDIKIKVFPDQNTCWHYDDKIRQYYLLNYYNLPITKTWVFWKKKTALDWAETAEYPVVFKLKNGAGSSNVFKVTDKETAKKITAVMFGKGVSSGKLPVKDSTSDVDFSIKKYIRKNARKLINIIEGNDSSFFWNIEKNYVQFQKFLPDNSYDTRITVIGDRAFGFRRMTRNNDFRASGSGVIDHNKDDVNLKCVEIAFEVSQKMNFQTMAYDFLLNDKKEPEICEISYTFQDEAVYNCTGYWDKELNWHEGHYWPQFCQLSDLLGIRNLKSVEKRND